MTKSVDSFGKTIARARRSLNKSQEALSRDLAAVGHRLDVQAVNALEHDRLDPRNVMLVKNLATILKLNDSELWIIAERHESDARRARDAESFSQHAMLAFRRTQDRR
jgi:ribosome-binding protein aMBF1 (putative translation factor)